MASRFPHCFRDDALPIRFRKGVRPTMVTPMDTTDPFADSRRKLAVSVFAAFGLLGMATGIAVLVASIVKTGGLEGILGGVFGGIFLALLIAVAGAWMAMRIMAPPAKPDPAAGADIEAALKDVLDEMEKARLETVAQVNARAAWRVPLCAAAGLLLWIYGQFTGDPGDLMDLAALIIVPGIMGYVWASLELSNKYARLYKERVLPRLAATFGELTWRPAVMPDIARLKDESLFQAFDDATADDELFGTHRSLPTSIVELKLEKGAGKNRRTVFDGLLLTLELPRDTNAVTAVVSDAGALGNFATRMSARHRERVRLEDPVFEKTYEVYGTDQVAARALLHPAFMEKLLALGELPDFGLPLVLCSGRVLQIASPKRFARDLFQAPSFQKPAASRDALVKLSDDIAAVIAAADAVIDLDHRFEVAALV